MPRWQRRNNKYERHFKASITNNEMVGALIVRARRDDVGLMEDLAAYSTFADAWRKKASSRFRRSTS